MSKKVVRVKIPVNSPGQLLALTRQVVDKHIADGSNSPLSDELMQKLAAILTPAEVHHREANDFAARSQVARGQRDGLLGIGEGQSMASPDTVLNLLTYARDQLLLHYRGQEHGLGEHGFDIVVSTAKSRTRKPKQTGAGPNGSTLHPEDAAEPAELAGQNLAR